MTNRQEDAFLKRQQANEVANKRPHPKHQSNGDETKFRHDSNTGEIHKKNCETGDLKNKQSYLVSFTKGMPHNEETGLVENPADFPKFVKAIDSGDPRDFRDVPLGHEDHTLGKKCNYSAPQFADLKPSDYDEEGGGVVVEYGFSFKSQKVNALNEDLTRQGKDTIKLRAWESQSAGNAFELEGPDAQAVTIPPAPKLGSAELTAEMAEVYSQALLRDVPFTAFNKGVLNAKKIAEATGLSYQEVLNVLQTKASDVDKVKRITHKLNHLNWFKGENLGKLSDSEKARCRNFKQTAQTAFRGITSGDNIGPYISQFLLAGSAGINPNDDCRSPNEGLIAYGAINIDQRVRNAKAGKDYMTDWLEWLDVQNGADLRGFEEYENDPTKKRRFMYTPRDLATYVHYDALYEAYLNACLIMLNNRIPFDSGIPYQESDNVDHQQGFAHFGGPHILSLVTEVATRALKAVRFQKFNIHRRCRPEVLAARISKADLLQQNTPELKKTFQELEKSGLLNEIGKLNGGNNYLLPMAFCEGSPMHPAYGAGHATVAGACITILKAFFDHSHPLEIVPESEASQQVIQLIQNLGHKTTVHSANLAYVAADNGKNLKVVPVLDENCEIAKLTVEGELNKLASNISIGRNWAGVHYFTDYYESILMGEEIAIGILEEQKLLFNENFSMTLPKFNGETIRI